MPRTKIYSTQPVILCIFLIKPPQMRVDNWKKGKKTDFSTFHLIMCDWSIASHWVLWKAWSTSQRVDMRNHLRKPLVTLSLMTFFLEGRVGALGIALLGALSSESEQLKAPHYSRPIPLPVWQKWSGNCSQAPWKATEEDAIRAASSRCPWLPRDCGSWVDGRSWLNASFS